MVICAAADFFVVDNFEDFAALEDFANLDDLVTLEIFANLEDFATLEDFVVFVAFAIFGDFLPLEVGFTFFDLPDFLTAAETSRFTRFADLRLRFGLGAASPPSLP